MRLNFFLTLGILCAALGFCPCRAVLATEARPPPAASLPAAPDKNTAAPHRTYDLRLIPFQNNALTGCPAQSGYIATPAAWAAFWAACPLRPAAPAELAQGGVIAVCLGARSDLSGEWRARAVIEDAQPPLVKPPLVLLDREPVFEEPLPQAQTPCWVFAIPKDLAAANWSALHIAPQSSSSPASSAALAPQSGDPSAVQKEAPALPAAPAPSPAVPLAPPAHPPVVPASDRPQIITDEKDNAVLVLIRGREVLRIDERGLHLRGDIDYTGVMTDGKLPALTPPVQGK
jgi:hypothetical protein